MKIRLYRNILTVEHKQRENGSGGNTMYNGEMRILLTAVIWSGAAYATGYNFSGCAPKLELLWGGREAVQWNFLDNRGLRFLLHPRASIKT